MKVIATAAGLLIAAGVITSDGNAPLAAAQSPAVRRPVPTALRGVYLVEVFGTRGSYDGQPYPTRDTIRRYAIDSWCTASACLAHGVRMVDDHEPPPQSRATFDLSLRGDAWVSDALVDASPCLADPTREVPLAVRWQFANQPDGTLAGTRTLSELTGGTGPCAGAGGEYATPVVLTHLPAAGP